MLTEKIKKISWFWNTLRRVLNMNVQMGRNDPNNILKWAYDRQIENNYENTSIWKINHSLIVHSYDPMKILSDK